MPRFQHAYAWHPCAQLQLTSANVGDQVLNTLLGKELGKQTGPVRLDLDLGRLGDGQDIVCGDLQAVVGKDQGLRTGGDR